MQTLSSGSVSTPKRQSCDRCHKQKLRCLRPSDGDGGACERCIRSKAQCVYSSSLPKGRPSSHRQNRQTANAANVRSSSRDNETSSEGTLLGVDNNDHPATVTDKTIIAEQHLDQTMTAAWDDSINWMEYIDNALPDQWYSELQNVCSPSQNLAQNIVLLTRPRIHSDGLTSDTPTLLATRFIQHPHRASSTLNLVSGRNRPLSKRYPVIATTQTRQSQRQRSLVCPA
jgi:hypothetical protein